ncbi:hypothetical protein CCACVL1_12239, partial [Corchorus capsularis]
MLSAHELLLRQQDAATSDISIPTANFARRSSHQGSRNSNFYKNRSNQRFFHDRRQNSSSSGLRIACKICDKPGHSAKTCRRGQQFFSATPSHSSTQVSPAPLASTDSSSHEIDNTQALPSCASDQTLGSTSNTTSSPLQ